MRLSKQSVSVLFPLLLLLATVIAYWPATRAGFIWDDDDYLTQNPVYAAPDALSKIWFQPRALPQYYPLVFTAFHIERKLWGLNPAGYHLVNILLHGGSAILLWHVLKRLKVPGAALAAAVFALHPMMVESVAWVTERKNTFSTFFFLASLLAFLAFVMPARRKKPAPAAGSMPTDAAATPAEPSRPSIAPPAEPEPPPRAPGRPWGLYAASLLLFILALLSKSVACGLAPVLVLILWWKRRPIAEHLLTIPFWILGFASGMLTVYLERTQVGATGQAWQLTFIEKILLAGRAVCFYAYKLLLPFDLSFYYTKWEINPAAWWQWLFPLLVVAVLVALFALRRKIGRAPAVAAASFLVLLFPALGFFALFPMLFSWVADHFAYLATLAFIPAVCGVLALLARRFLPGRRDLRALVALPLLAILAARTFAVSMNYQDNETLFRSVLAYNDRHGEPRHWNALSILSAAVHARANEAADAGLQDEAAALNKEALEYDLESLKVRPGYAVAYNNIANYYLTVGDYPEALKNAREAERLEPRNYKVLLTLGNIYSATGDLDQAEKYYLAVVNAERNVVDHHIKLARLLMRKGEFDRARNYIANARFIAPDDPQAYLLQGYLDAQQNRLRPALDAFRRAAELAPTNLEALDAFARQVANMLDVNPLSPDFQTAARYNQYCVQTTQGKNASYLDTFGMLLARSGHPVEALGVWRDALSKLNPQGGVRNSLERHIAFVEKNIVPATTSAPATQRQ
jgi:tetratricopeptide (TPR) repeat protein